MNIYVSNLSFGVGDQDLVKLFSSYGEVSSAKVITDKFTGKSKGFGFVEMTDLTTGTKAINDLNGSMIDGRSIRVNEARPKEANPRNRFDDKW